MDQRLKLHDILVGVLGSPNVYFQPPSNIQMTYPCIVYGRDSEYARHANGELYLHKKRYQVTVIDRDPDSPLPNKVGRLPMCRFVRHFKADSLNHDIYNLYF